MLLSVYILFGITSLSLLILPEPMLDFLSSFVFLKSHFNPTKTALESGLFLRSSGNHFCFMFSKVTRSATEKQTRKHVVFSYDRTRILSNSSCPAVSHN